MDRTVEVLLLQRAAAGFPTPARRRQGLPEPIRELQRRALRHFAATGQAPPHTILAAWAAELGMAVQDALGQLVGADLVEADPATGMGLLGERGYPVPRLLWRGPLDADWLVVVQARLPGQPPRTLDAATLDSLLALVELQAGQAPRLGEGGWDVSWWIGVVLCPRPCRAAVRVVPPAPGGPGGAGAGRRRAAGPRHRRDWR